MRGLTISPDLRAPLTALCLAAAALVPFPAAGHPHAAIDMRSAVVFGDDGRVVALRIEWTFDEIYSSFATATLHKGDAARFEKSLQGLARRNLDNLDEYNYFVDLRVNGARARLGRVDDYQTSMKDNRLWLRFVAPLAQPADPKTAPISYAVYDPTYYIEILYPRGDRIETVGPAGNCRARIRPPEPNPEARAFAGSLGPNETVDAGIGAMFSGRTGTSLGELFAETALIECN